MMSRRRHYWTLLRASFWFVPGVMAVAYGALAAGLLVLDSSLAPAFEDSIYSGGAGGARALLSTVAGSMVTVAGVGFSITIVALVLASTQFGPRLLTLFMRDLTSQVTLGTFAGTFIYCVLVLRSVRGVEEGGAPFIPAISITAAILLTLVSVAALVLFFHHVAVSIQAPKLVSAVARDLDRAIDVLYPSELGHGGPEPDPTLVPSIEHDLVVAATVDGYLQVVDDAALLVLAERHDLVVRLLSRPGLFVIRGNPILVVRPAAVGPEVADALRSTMIVGDVRTSEDDIEFAVRQLVEVALRALSPAINDPFTAMAAVDWLGGALARLATEDFPSRHRYDDAGRLRIVADVSTFPGIVHTIYSRIRHYGGDSPVVLNRLLEAIVGFGPHLRSEADRRQVRLEADAVMETGRARIASTADLEELARRHEAALAALGRSDEASAAG